MCFCSSHEKKYTYFTVPYYGVRNLILYPTMVYATSYFTLLWCTQPHTVHCYGVPNLILYTAMGVRNLILYPAMVYATSCCTLHGVPNLTLYTAMVYPTSHCTLLWCTQPHTVHCMVYVFWYTVFLFHIIHSLSLVNRFALMC